MVKSAPYTRPREGEIVIKNHAVAINPIDWVTPVFGTFVLPWIKYPFIFGSDLAGEVVEVGKGVTRFSAGDRVLGHASGMDSKRNSAAEGAFQEYTVVLAHMAAPIPDTLSYENAAVLPLTLSSRLMAFLTFTLLGSYLLFSLQARLHLPVVVAAREVTLFQVISTATLGVCAWLSGFLSRRVQRLKPFVVVGALLMTLSMSLLAMFSAWIMLWPIAVLFGTGFGLFVGVDIALAVRVLPSASEPGKDLGLMYTAIFLPLIVTPLIGAFILNLFQENFAALFGVAALASVLAALLVLPIRAVR